MKITAKTARQTTDAVIAKRAEERRKKTLDYLDGSLTDAIANAMNDGDSVITVRTNKELDWDLIVNELRKEQEDGSVFNAIPNTNGTLKISW